MNETKLFYIGGLNTQTYQQAGDVEVYDVETDQWLAYMELPTSGGVGFPSSPDYGCLVVDRAVGQGRVLSVGQNGVVALDWTTGTLQTIAEWQQPGLGSCSFLRDQNGLT